MRVAHAGAGAPGRTIHVEHCMGTVFTIDVRDPGNWDGAIAAVVTWLHRVDAVFSTYRADSDLCRLRRGELPIDLADPLVPEVLALCGEVQQETGGAFTAMPGGVLDPTGLVKGWAVERASGLLRAHGSANHAVNGGGDLQLAGGQAPGEAWQVGIADPRDRTRVVAVTAGRDMAVATSGVAERGAHIVDPFTGRPAAAGLGSVTVVGPSLTRADAYATAGFVMGEAAIGWVETLPTHEAMLVRLDGTLAWTPGFPRAARRRSG